ncbi:MAG TPA: helix-turn-helix transcriptional regulator [Candidatus Limnocylindria bacterium]|jgi:DNA-binding XRE family transcriptional regulator|nr:helix-turn-helix transcriptional regulator [Candidatus Limnocylindria bacterium]
MSTSSEANGRGEAHADIMLAVHLRRVRETCHLTRADAAEALGWKPARLAQIEGGMEPTLDELIALGRLYALEGIRMFDDLEARSRGVVPESAENGGGRRQIRRLAAPARVK